MHKSITLTELIISIVLLGVALVGAFGLLTASSSFYVSSDTKSAVLNELNYLIDHIDKEVYQAAGWVGNPAVSVTTPSSGIFVVRINQFANTMNPDYNNLTTVTYRFNIANNRVRFRRGSGSWRVLSNRLIQDPSAPLSINFNPSTGILTIDNLQLVFDPRSHDPANPDQRRNPTIATSNQRFSTWMQSLR